MVKFEIFRWVKCLTPAKCAVKCVVWVLNDMTLFSPLMLSMENPYRVLEPREIILGSEIFHMEKVRLVKRIEKKKS